jgi:hypothetical protein
VDAGTDVDVVSPEEPDEFAASGAGRTGDEDGFDHPRSWYRDEITTYSGARDRRVSRHERGRWVV